MTLDLPRADRLRLLPQNDTACFVYWQISERTRRMTERHTGHAWSELSFMLRFYDATGLPFDGRTARDVCDIRIGLTDRCYVRGLKPGNTYAADIGFVEGNGCFVALYRSKAVVMPGGISGAGSGMVGRAVSGVVGSAGSGMVGGAGSGIVGSAANSTWDDEVATSEAGLAAEGGRFCGYTWHSAGNTEWLTEVLLTDAECAGNKGGAVAGAATTGFTEEKP